MWPRNTCFWANLHTEFKYNAQKSVSDRVWAHLAKPMSRSGHQRLILEVHIFFLQMTHASGQVLSQEYNKRYKKCVKGHPGSQMRSLLVNS